MTSEQNPAGGVAVRVEADFGRVPTELDWWQSEVEYKRDALREIRALIAELYSERGEDARTAELCNKAMRIADAHA